MNTDNYSAARKFYDIAQCFCDVVNNDCASQKIPLEPLLAAAVQVYSAALGIPSVEPESEDADTKERNPLNLSLDDSDIYWEVFDPYILEEPVCGSLSDDISSVFYDLCEGMKCYQENRINDALWIWRFGFRTHWSYHLASAIRVLNQLVMAENM